MHQKLKKNKKKPLEKYREKRTFEKTPEPLGLPVFCVQKHAARHLHYDLRLEHKGVLLSWAVPKEPSLDPHVKRLAIQVEDHPLEYRHFEGVIPKGNYGAGTVEIWDEGTFESPGIDAGLKKGHLTFTLHGKRLKGTFSLVKLKQGENQEEPHKWLLIKGKEEKMHLPGFIKPMLASLKKAPFDDPDWLFEIKWDGYRALAYIDSGVRLYSRNQTLFNSLYPQLVEDLKKIPVSCILDGEIVLLDDQGRSNFQQLQNYQHTHEGNLAYYVFDLLFLNGEDLRALPLIKRKEKLETLLKDHPCDYVRFSDHVEKKGIAFFNEAKKFDLEGIIAKKKQSGYHSTRSKEWLKIKTHLSQEVLIGGFTQARASRIPFGALLLGVYKDKKFTYIGHVGTGFTEASLKDLYEKMLPLKTDQCPFDKKIKTNMPATWIKPKLACEVVFTEWTSDGALRHPVYKGLIKP